MEYLIKIQNSNKRGKSEDCWTTSFLQCKEIFYIVSQTNLLFSLIWWEKYETTLYKTWIFLGRSCGFLKLNCDFVRTFFFYKFPPRRCILVQFSRFWFRRKADIKLWQIIITLLCFQIFEYRPRQCVRNKRKITIDFLNILQRAI